jgi:predicted small integral membrane protein
LSGHPTYQELTQFATKLLPVSPLLRAYLHFKKVRGKSQRRYNSRVRQPMRHVMALRVCRAALVFAIALFYTILVLNNITDYRSNYEFVRHVLMMDSTFPGNHLMWRAVNSPLVHTVFYLGIIAWESVTMLLCWWGGVRMLKSYRADSAQFATALNVAVIALTSSMLMWLVAFLDVGGEWFLMWQSQIWNGQEAAFRMFTVVGVVFLVVVQREPTPGSSANLP